MGEIIMDIIAFLILVLIFCTPGILITLEIIFWEKKKEKPLFELIAFLIGTVYMVFTIILWGLPDYQSPINIYDSGCIHEPFNIGYCIAIELFALWGFISYFILKFARKKLPPLIKKRV